MLLLSRMLHKSIIIGDDIEVKIMSINGLSVGLGIKAPREISVHREEIYRKIYKQNKAMNDIKLGENQVTGESQ